MAQLPLQTLIYGLHILHELEKSGLAVRKFLTFISLFAALQVKQKLGQLHPKLVNRSTFESLNYTLNRINLCKNAKTENTRTMRIR